MVHVQATINIQASPAEVFRLLCDPERKARLNPDVEVLHAASLTPGPMGVGSRIFYRLRTPNGVCEFHCEISAFETNRVIEWVSDTRPSFRVRQLVEPTATGCQLVHDECLESATPAPVKPRRWSFTEIAQAFQQAAGLDVPAAVDDKMQGAMQASLARWLENIRSCLEQSRAESGGGLHAIATVAF